MSPRHRMDSPSPVAEPPTRVDDGEELGPLTDAVQRLGDAVTDTQRAAIDEAVAAADRRGRRVYWLSLLGMFLLAVAICLPFALIGKGIAQQAAADTAALKAGTVASAEVESGRTSSLEVVRRDLNTVVNPARVAAGLAPCPDPGPASNAFQVAWVTGECAGELRTIGDLEKRGAIQIPGVMAPDPDSGAFPSPAN